MLKNKYDFMQKISPQMRAVAERVRAWNAAHPERVNDYVTDYIEERKFWNEGGPQMVRTEELDIPGGPHGKVNVRLHYPTDKKDLPILIFIHGGGFSLGNNDTHSRVMRILAQKTGCCVIGVNYVLAPEAKFPSQILETVEVVRYFHQHAAEWGLDGNDISMAGDSGGATLIFAAMLYLRDEYKEGKDYLTSLLLYYGMYGMRDGVSGRMWGNDVDEIIMDGAGAFDPGYIDEKDIKSPYYDTTMNADLTYDIPPCFICCGECDPLLDNSTTLYEMISDKGFTCEYKVYPGIMHAFLHYSRMLDASYDAMQAGADFMARARNIKEGK